MLRSLQNYLTQAARGSPRGWHPLLGVCYLTYACDFRCPFCSDGAGRPYHALDPAILSSERFGELLRILRRFTDYLVLTGGEPFLYPGVDVVLAGLPKLGYDGVVLTTNGADLDTHLGAVARGVQYLVVSLNSLDPEKANRWFGKGPGMLRRILDNLDRAERFPGRRYEIIISSVATPANLDDLFGVYAYAKQRGFRFALCPQLVGVKAHASLAGNPRYRALYDMLIAEKKRGAAVNGTDLYLEHMRDLTKFTCSPSTVVAISPVGDVYYPCLERGTVAGNLLETPDLHRLRAEGVRRHGPEPACDNRCHSACALGFSLAVKHPTSLISELGYLARRRLSGFVGKPDQA